MSVENPRWGAPRIHGELLKLGFEAAQSSVAKYMVKRQRPPSQGWRTFLRNHAPNITAMDLFVVPTIGFDPLYALIIVRLGRRDLAWINVTTNPTAEWIARPITEAFPWDGVPGYMIRDRDRIYGTIVRRRLRAIGSIRRECLDHIFVLGEAPIYAESCDATRATTTTSERIGHWTKIRLSLVRFSGPDASKSYPVLGGFHHTMPEFEFSVHTAGL
jgi:hypothetical protein